MAQQNRSFLCENVNFRVEKDFTRSGATADAISLVRAHKRIPTKAKLRGFTKFV